MKTAEDYANTLHDRSESTDLIWRQTRDLFAAAMADARRAALEECATFQGKDVTPQEAKDWDPFGPDDQIPEDIRRDTVTERGWKP